MNTKHAWMSVLASLALVLGVAGMSMAESFTNSGTYMFTESGNDSNFGIGNLEALIENWFANNGHPQYDDIELEEYAKVDEPGASNGGLTVSYGDEDKSGTWETDEAVNFYSVKAGNSFAFYWENPAATSGTWDTSDVFAAGNGNQPAISHISTWIMSGGGGPGPEPIPEPSTVFLMGLGLAGLGVTVRKRHRK
ncbi:MAG: PEP-CTERM sorting domain-containing protein [Thermodesulfobacteriota bacterium]